MHLYCGMLGNYHGETILGVFCFDTWVEVDLRHAKSGLSCFRVLKQIAELAIVLQCLKLHVLIIDEIVRPYLFQS